MIGTYDIPLVVLSIVVAVIASYVALGLASRVAASQGSKTARYWLIGGAVSMGTGIWSMHFIGMLAFRLPIPMSYDIQVTLLSLLIAMIVSGIALYTVSRGDLSVRRLFGAGLLMGIGIASMHYTGMAAMQMEPPIRYDPLLFVLSVLIAIVAAMAALWIAFQLRSETIFSAFWKKAGSALVMGAAISGMHYTGMAAAIFAPNSLCTVDPQEINNVWLAGTIGGFTFMFLITTLLISMFDARLADHSAKLAAIIKNANDAIISRALDSTILSWNAGAERLFGYSAAEALGRPIEELIHLPEARARITQNIETVRRGEAVASYETRRKTKDGRVIDVLSSVSPIRNEAGEITGASIILHDISALKQAEKNLRLASQVIENILEGVMITDASNHIISVNPAFAAITGYAPQEVIGKTPAVLSSGLQSEEFYQAMWASIKATGHWTGEIWDRRKNGELYCESMSVSTVKNPHGEILYHTAIFSDITERKQAAEQLNHLAQYDTLTGLPNRSLFRDRLAHAMARAKRNSLMLALMYFDLDRFKEINDTLGHTAGDAVLQAVAKVLKESLRDVDTIARLGGDEFTLIMEDIAHVDQASAVAEKMLQIFADPLIIEGREIYITASIGITLYPFGVDDIDALLQTADIAMYHAKEEGRNTYEFYVPEMNAHAAADLDMETLLRRALERQEFTLHYQPKVAVKSGRITGVEALIRWNSKELGSVSPAKFIPLAEKTGLIVPIGEWVLRTACAQNKAWQEQGFPPLLMSVNLSPRQFRQKNLLEMVTAGLQDAGLDPCFLELEITEGMIMLRPENAIVILQQLHKLGVQLSVDDFGTGYSSLAYLKRFPVQKLKIDQSFMRDLNVDRDDAGIVTAVVAMAKSLNLEVVAEGVETAEQLAFLAKLDCEEYQGYYFSRPVPAEEFARLLPPSPQPSML